MRSVARPFNPGFRGLHPGLYYNHPCRGSGTRASGWSE